MAKANNRKKRLNKLSERFNDKFFGEKYFTDTTFLVSDIGFDYDSGYRYFVRDFITHNVKEKFRTIEEATKYLEEVI